MPYRPGSGTLAVKAILSPAGDQVNSPTPSSASVICIGSPPAASTTCSCGLPLSGARTNAIRRPSGEYAGSTSVTPRVIRRDAPSALISQSWATLRLARRLGCPTATTARWPSGWTVGRETATSNSISVGFTAPRYRLVHVLAPLDGQPVARASDLSHCATTETASAGIRLPSHRVVAASGATPGCSSSSATASLLLPDVSLIGTSGSSLPWQRKPNLPFPLARTVNSPS